MSLIVQVNSSSAPAGATGALGAPGPGATTQQPNNAVPSQPTVVVQATGQPQPGQPQQPQAQQEQQQQTQQQPMQNSLATLVAAAEQQQQKQQNQHKLQSVGIPTRITNLNHPHLVQHHPPPLRMVQLSGGPQGCNGPTTVVTTVALPQAPTPVPLRHALPQAPVGVRPAPQLPRSPVRQHQLPTTPLQRSLVQHQQGSRLSPQLRTNGQQCIMVNPARTSHLSMLPQNPTPGLMPSSASVHNLLPQSPSTFVPLPAHHHHQHPQHHQQQQQHGQQQHGQQQHHPQAHHGPQPQHHRIQQTMATVTNNSTTTILPPTLLNRQFFSRTGLPIEAMDGHLRSRLEMGVDLGGSTQVARAPVVHTGRSVAPSARQQQRDRRSLPCQLALQDHNYVSKIPPTPSPPPPPPALPVLQPPTVLQVTQDGRKRLQSGGGQVVVPAGPAAPGQQQGSNAAQTAQSAVQAAAVANLPMHPNPSFNSNPNLRGLIPELPLPSRSTSATTVATTAASLSPAAQPAPSAGGRLVLQQPQQQPQQPPQQPPPPPQKPAQTATSSPAGLLNAVTGQPGSNATAGEPIGTSVLPSRVQANLNSMEEAGVGLMAPLVEDDNSHLSNSSTDEQERGGEETETAPEGEPEDDSITRCICDFLHDDGYMICCDKCLVWQHVVCMGLDKNNIPDEYLCEVCKPRPIDRKRAKAMQARRRNEIRELNNSSSSDGEHADKRRHPKKPKFGQKTPNASSSAAAATTAKEAGSNKKMLDRKATFVSGLKNKHQKKQRSQKGLQKIGSPSLLEKAKKQYKKRKSSTSASTVAPPAAAVASEAPATAPLPEKVSSSSSSKKVKIGNVSPKKSAIARRKSQIFNDSDLDSDAENNVDEQLEPNVEASQTLRSWIDNYEEAVTNHYSPELRARLSSGRLNGLGGDLRSSAIGGVTRCNVSLKGNGVKILTAGNNLTSGSPVIECKGRIMLAKQYRESNKAKADGLIPPYVFFYQLSDTLEICLDGKTYGNDGRFCRRSATYNAELKHVIDKGSLHLFIVAIKGIDKNQEVLLPPEGSVELSSGPLPSINADLKEISKTKPMNGLLSGLSSPEEAPLRDTIKKKERKKVKVLLRAAKNENMKIQKRTTGVRKGKMKAEKAEVVKKEPKQEPEIIKTEIKEEEKDVDINDDDIKPVKLTSPKLTSPKLNSLKLGSPKLSSPKLGSPKLTSPKLNSPKLTSPKLTSPKQINSPKITSPKLTSPKLNSPKITSPKITSPKLPLNGKVKTEDEEEIEDDLEDQRSPGSPSKNGPNPCPKGAGSGSPTKMGLPDNSGLIVGVNTINYDASSSVRNKAKSREERKMEMIMKAIEAMEKAEQRKKDTTGSESGQTPTGTGNAGGKRRRSSSSYRNSVSNAFDSNVEASSADESKPEPKRNRKRGRSNSKQSNAGTPQRRRSRVLSGGSVSNMSNDELAANNQIQSSEIPSNTPGTGQTGSGNAMSSVPFRFPKTKKSLMSDWLQESESNSVVDDDDVSANYLKGSRSPPGIATHLLRTASSPVKNVCSAKKRWLRQAISEDHTDADVAYVNGGSYSEEINMPSPSSEAAMDTVTPLKKRRLANYKEDTENEEKFLENLGVGDSPIKDAQGHVKHVPNGLKKQILQNLVLEAVLDKAMEDMLATPATLLESSDQEAKTGDESKNEASEHQQPMETEENNDVKVENNDTKPVVKAPTELIEPNSAFKSFFNSNVSLEALEAEIAASKKQREAIEVKEEVAEPQTPTHATSSIDMKDESTSGSSHPVPVEKQLVKTSSSSEIFSNNLSTISEDTATTNLASSPSPTTKEMLSGKISSTNLTKNVDNEKVVSQETTKMVQKDYSTEVIKPIAAATATAPTTTFDNSVITKQKEATVVTEAIPDTKPKAKKRVSLADYKSLRRVSSTSTNPNSTPTISGSHPVPVQQPEVTTATPSIMTATPTFTNNSSSINSSNQVLSSQNFADCRISVKTSRTSSENSSNKSSLLDLQQQETEIGEDPGTPTQDEGRVLNHLSAKPSSSIIMQTGSTNSLSISGSGSISASVSGLSSKAISGLSSKAISGHGSLSSSHLPPSLNTLPLFEKLDKLELAQQEIKRKAASQNSYISSESNNITTVAPSSVAENQHSSTSSAVLPPSVRSPVFEPKREDLTSRLQKEFGLLVEADTSNSDLDQTLDLDEDGGGDATPEEDSPPPPPPSGSHLSGSSTRFLPSQIPSYTTQQPQQKSYPASTAQASSQPPPVPHVHHYSSNLVNRAKYPPPPPPPSSMTSSGGIGGYQVNFPPPPPPTSVGSYVKDDHSQPPPQPLPPPPPAPLPPLKQALNNGPGLTGSNSSRRPPSKDYYNRGSPGSGGGRGYYTSHRDRRDHGFRERDSNHGSRGGDPRDRGEPRDRHGSDRDYRSQSSSRRNAYQSRNYY